MKNSNYIYDAINIKDLPDIIASFVKDTKGNNKSYNSLRIIMTRLLEGISIEVKDSYLNRIQKYMSNSESMNITIIDDINNGIYDKELKKSIHEMIKYINRLDNCKSLYKNLIDNCVYIHFDKDEYHNIINAYNMKDYGEFTFLLFKHAFTNYKSSVPTLLAERIYNEALTLSLENVMRGNMFREASDLGHSYASIMYGDIVGKEDAEKATDYYLRGKELPPALWNIAFNLENFKLSTSIFEKIKKECSDYISFACENNGFSHMVSLGGQNRFEDECMITAYKMYYYLAKKKNFPKAYNSLGKLMIRNLVVYGDEENKSKKVKTIDTGLEYLNEAVKFGNVNAMVNLASYYRDSNHNDEKYKTMVKLFETAASIGEINANVHLAKIYLEEGKVNQAIDYLEFAAERKNVNAIYELGKIEEANMNFDKAQKYYENAIALGNPNAAIDLSTLYFRKFENDINSKLSWSYLDYAINLLEKGFYKFESKNQSIAKKRIEEWKLIRETC